MVHRSLINPTIEASEATTQLPALLRSVAEGRTRVVLAEKGVPIAAIVSSEDLARLDSIDDDDDAIFAEMRAAFAGVPDEEIERETDRILGINQDEGVVEK